MVVKWRCPGCTAIYDDNEALMLLLAKNFTPVEMEEPKQPVKSKYPEEESEEREERREKYPPRYPRSTQENRKEDEEEDLTIR